jgi:glucosamine 6-phosphate synthetase-like amidotransferase/phosphosugar isomerase protein
LKLFHQISSTARCKKVTDFYKTCYNAILSQRSSITDTMAGVDLDYANILRDAKRVIFLGCGDSFAVAEFGRWCMSAAGINCFCCSPEEIRHVPVREGTLVVGVTASGRSLVTIAALEYAREHRAATAVLTDAPDGAASKHADHVWTTKAGVSTYNTSPSSPTTTGMAYILQLLKELENIHGESLGQDLDRLRELGDQMIVWGEKEGKAIAELARKDRPLYFISEGPNHVAAQVGMMKFDEYSLVRGISAVKEEFRHHYNLAVKPGDCAVLITDCPASAADEVYLGVMKDTLKLAAHHLYVKADFELKTPLAQVIPNTIALQMAAYHNAVVLNPDKTEFLQPNASSFEIY